MIISGILTASLALKALLSVTESNPWDKCKDIEDRLTHGCRAGKGFPSPTLSSHIPTQTIAADHTGLGCRPWALKWCHSSQMLCWLTRDGVSPISYSIRKDEAGKLANEDNNEVPVISSSFSPCFPLSFCPRALPLNLSRFCRVDMLQPLWEGCFVQGWVKAISLANPRDWLCGCSVCSRGRWGWVPFSVFPNEAARLREWSVWIAKA